MVGGVLIFFMASSSFLGHAQALARARSVEPRDAVGMPLSPFSQHPPDAGRRFACGIRRTVREGHQAARLCTVPGLDGRVPIALDGSEHFCSRKIKCEQCSTRRRADGGTEYFHAFLGASMVAPGHKQVLPLPPEFIAPQDGAEKQDCERNAAKRWLARHGADLAHLRPGRSGDDLFACQPIVAAIQDAGGNFILTCKPASHKTIAEYLQGAELQEHRQTICKRGKRTTTTYRWLNAVPLRATDDAILVNWFSIETFNAKGKRTYYNSFVTDLAITRDTVAELAGGRARWKIENETFNVLKTNGYNLEHNFGHGKKTLASILVTLNLLAFAFHTAAYLGVLAGEPPSWPWPHVSLLRASADCHRLCCLPGLASPAPVHRRGRDTATLTTGIPPSRHSTHLNTEPKRRKITTTPWIFSNCGPTDIDALSWRLPLLPYQRAGIAAWSNHPVLLADEMGLGKTIQAIAALRILFARGEISARCSSRPPGSCCSGAASSATGRRSSLWRPCSGQRTSAARPGAGGAGLSRRLRGAALGPGAARRLRPRPPALGRRRPRRGAAIKNAGTDLAVAVKRAVPRHRSWALTGTPLENRLDDARLDPRLRRPRPVRPPRHGRRAAPSARPRCSFAGGAPRC